MLANRPNGSLSLYFALCCAAVSGCGPKSPATGEVSGQITYNSQPVTAGMVVYENPSKAWIGAGELGSDGRYQISKLRVGEYTVSVQPPVPKMPNESDSSIEEIKAKLGTIKAPDPANIPRPVRSTQTSSLKASVVEGDQEVSFELSAKPNG